MDSLNINQKKAVETIDGPLLIIAGPGTGKTHTLVERVIYMVNEKNIDPGEIMISTFTNKAALELLDRLARSFDKLAIKKDVNDMLIGNFHSICRKILDDNLAYTVLERDYYTIDNTEQRYLLFKHINDFRRVKGYTSLVNTKTIKSEISSLEKIVNTVAEEGILDRSFDNPIEGAVFEIVGIYEKILEKNNMLDFSRTLYYCYKLLYENPQVLEDVQRQTKYIMIDEYQDTNRVQEQIIFLLASKEGNICVVGDDDQGLYRFRGASVKNILHFPTRFDRPVKLINLSENYRSDGRIVEFFTDFIRSGQARIENFDKYRFDKDLRAFDGSYYDNSVLRVRGEGRDNWLEKNVDLVEDLKARGEISSYNQVAFLFSSVNHDRAKDLEKAFRDKGIKVYLPTLNTLLSRKEIHQLIGGLYLIFEDFIGEGLKARDGASQNFLEKCRDQLDQEDVLEFINRMKDYLARSNFTVDLIDLSYRLFAYPPFSTYLDQGGQEAKNMSRFLNLLESYCYINMLYKINRQNLDRFIVSFFYDYIGFLKDEKVAEFDEEVELPDEDSVSFLTIHKSKGMEYPVVVAASLWDEARSYRYYNKTDNILNILSEKKSGEGAFEPEGKIELLDFYRKYYTAFSRAQNLLVLSSFHQDGSDLTGQIFKEFYDGLRDYESVKGLNLNLGPVKKTHLSKVYSYTSHILIYRNCPFSYRYLKELKFINPSSLSAHYGSLVHETIEYVNKSHIKGLEVDSKAIKTYLYSVARNKYRQGALGLNEELLSQAVEEVMAYRQKMDEFGEILSSELEISMARKTYLLQGNVDMVYRKDGGLCLLDFKTSNPYEKEYDKLDSYFRQINLYAYLLEETKRTSLDKISLYFSPGQGQLVQGTRQKTEDLLEEIDGVVEKIEEKDFNKKTEDTSLCKFCPLKYYCKRVD